MKKNIHPDYAPILFRDIGDGSMFLTRSTMTSNKTAHFEDGNEYPVVDVEVTNATHPFWTGKGRVLDTAGRVERFNQRYGRIR